MAKQRTPSSPCIVRLGTRNSMGPEKRYISEGAARKAMVAFFRQYLEFVSTRSHTGGPKNIHLAVEEVASLPIHKSPAQVECLVDETTQLRVIAEVRKA